MSFFTISITLETASVNAESPIAKLSLECGILRDHRIDFTVNGYTPNGNVHWEFVDSNGNINAYGYFETDEFGRFYEYIITDKMTPDTYFLRNFDDNNNDFIKNSNGSKVILNYQIPCDNVIF